MGEQLVLVAEKHLLEAPRGLGGRPRLEDEQLVAGVASDDPEEPLLKRKKRTDEPAIVKLQIAQRMQELLQETANREEWMSRCKVAFKSKDWRWLKDTWKKLDVWKERVQLMKLGKLRGRTGLKPGVKAKGDFVRLGYRAPGAGRKHMHETGRQRLKRYLEDEESAGRKPSQRDVWMEYQNILRDDVEELQALIEAKAAEGSDEDAVALVGMIGNRLQPFAIGALEVKDPEEGAVIEEPASVEDREVVEERIRWRAMSAEDLEKRRDELQRRLDNLMENADNRRKELARILHHLNANCRKTNRLTQLTVEQECERVISCWRQWDRLLETLCSGDEEKLKEHVADPEQWVENLKETQLIFADQVPWWVAERGGTVELEASRLRKVEAVKEGKERLQAAAAADEARPCCFVD